MIVHRLHQWPQKLINTGCRTGILLTRFTKLISIQPSQLNDRPTPCFNPGARRWTYGSVLPRVWAFCSLGVCACITPGMGYLTVSRRPRCHGWNHWFQFIRQTVQQPFGMIAIPVMAKCKAHFPGIGTRSYYWSLRYRLSHRVPSHSHYWRETGKKKVYRKTQKAFW